MFMECDLDSIAIYSNWAPLILEMECGSLDWCHWKHTAQNASEETSFHKASDRPWENTSAPRHRRLGFCLCGGVKMSALQSVMSQLVISIRCNCITPAAASDWKKSGQICLVWLRTGTSASLVMSRMFVHNTFNYPSEDNSIYKYYLFTCIILITSNNCKPLKITQSIKTNQLLKVFWIKLKPLYVHNSRLLQLLFKLNLNPH